MEGSVGVKAAGIKVRQTVSEMFPYSEMCVCVCEMCLSQTHKHRLVMQQVTFQQQQATFSATDDTMRQKFSLNLRVLADADPITTFVLGFCICKSKFNWDVTGIAREVWLAGISKVSANKTKTGWVSCVVIQYSLSSSIARTQLIVYGDKCQWCHLFFLLFHKTR